MISFLPEHYLILGILILLSFFSLTNLSVTHKFPRLSMGIIVLICILLFNFIFLVIYDLSFGDVFFNYFFIKLEIHSFIQLFMCFCLLLLLFNLTIYNKNSNINVFEFYIIVLLSLFSLCLLISSRELISFFFLLELQGFAFYILASFKRFEKSSIESGIKYFILSSFSSILILLGFSLLYSITGLMDFNELYFYFNNNNTNNFILTLSFVFVLSGFLFKMYHFPFHFWVADIYQGSPLSSVSIFSTIPLLSIFYSFYVLCIYVFHNIITDIKFIIFILSLGTMIIGTIYALYQRKLKRLLAYSSITNIGYIITALLNDNVFGLSNSLLFIIIYLINLICIFILFMNLFDLKNKHYIESFYSLSGLYKTHKNISFLLIVYLFSIAGIPPFSSFFSKLFLITSLLNESYYLIVGVMIITTFFSCFYYLRIVKTISYNSVNNSDNIIDIKTWYFIKPFSYLTSFILVLLILFHIYFGLFPSFLSSFVFNSTISFMI
jgi:NADH-quinone oxidoreductase subunit N